MNKRDSLLIRMFAIASLACLFMITLRITFYGSTRYIFLVWNLFLAWIPFLISLLLSSSEARKRNKFLVSGILLSWLLFFPNSPYIVTDLIHLKLQSKAPIWFDSLLVILFAWTGLMLGFCSLYKVHVFIEKYFSRYVCWGLILSVIVLCGYGIYLGRFERWNSWDVVTDTGALFSEIGNHIIHPFRHISVLIISMLFTSFLFIGYLTTFTLIRAGNHEE